LRRLKKSLFYFGFGVNKNAGNLSACLAPDSVHILAAGNDVVGEGFLGVVDACKGKLFGWLLLRYYW
jgi:hypothetical protein